MVWLDGLSMPPPKKANVTHRDGVLQSFTRYEVPYGWKLIYFCEQFMKIKTTKFLSSTCKLHFNP